MSKQLSADHNRLLDSIIKAPKPKMEPDLDFRRYTEGEAACYYALSKCREEDRRGFEKALAMFVSYRQEAEYRNE